MRRPFAPVPQHQIVIAEPGAGGETRNKNAGDPARDQAPRHPPASRLSSLEHVRVPAGGKRREGRIVVPAASLVAQVRNVRAVNVVTAQNAWIDFERVLAVGLLDASLDAERKIERRHAFGIKPAAVDGSAVPGKRLERPLGMVRAVAGRLKPQAKPPRAM